MSEKNKISRRKFLSGSVKIAILSTIKTDTLFGTEGNKEAKLISEKTFSLNPIIPFKYYPQKEEDMLKQIRILRNQ